MGTEHIRRWKIGDVEVVRIAELFDFQDDIWVLLKDATPEIMLKHDWLFPHFATTDGRMRMNFQGFVVTSRGKLIMVDPCIGNDRQRGFDVFCNLQTSFLEDIKAAGFPPDRFDTVICTHLHIDHCGWNTQLVDGQWVPTFPNARYLLSQREFDMWEANAQAGLPHMEHVVDSIRPIVAAGLADFVAPDHQITDEIRLIPTPGHTPGHVSVHISSAGQEAVITGDVVHHPVQFAAPDHINNFDMDDPQGRATRRAFFARFADQPTTVIGSHFFDPTSGRIIKDGDAWRFEADEA